MDPRDAMEPEQLEMLARIFAEQLLACLEECAHGRNGLFSDYCGDGAKHRTRGPKRRRLRELALALQGVFAQQDERHALCDEFLDLCSIHGESHPGESRLARTFLARIERGEVGSPTEPEKKPW